MIIRFDAQLYPRKAVEAAARAFEDIAPMRVREGAGGVEVEVQGESAELDAACDGDFEGEFANQALWEAGR